MSTISTTITAIKNLSVTDGVKVLRILDITSVPDDLAQRDLPVLMPRPDSFLTMSQERQAWALDASAPRQVTWTTHWLLLVATVGQGRGVFEPLGDVLTWCAALAAAAFSDDTLSTSVDAVFEIEQTGLVTSPAGTQYHGAVVSWAITELAGGAS